jgi:uncharacterized protein (DUF2235 family)
MRNLIVCLDGTDNQFSARNTNVIRLFQCLDRDPEGQIAYYDPGVGTIWEPGTLTKTAQKVEMLFGLAFGLGVSRNVAEAYLFLMQAYQPDDHLYIFGFSRGALEARALAALIYRCGLLQVQLASLQPYAMKLFEVPGNFPVVDSFKETFSQEVGITFLGLWDTVTSYGNVWSPIHWPNVTKNPAVAYVAHAIAIDERRAFFRQNRWSPSPRQRVEEVWFAGVHSDVGGGYDASTGRLWAITLDWMIRHAAEAGLRFVNSAVQTILSAGKTATPDAETDQHDSLTTAWKALECVPRRHRVRNADGTYGPPSLMIPALQTGFKGRPREIFAGERVHRSAIQRFVGRPDYRPDTLVGTGLTLDRAKSFLAGSDEIWTVQPREEAASV